MLGVNEKRNFARVPLSLPGRLFFSDSEPKNCEVVNLSCTGAGVHCDEASSNANAVLYIEHLGRVTVVGRRRENGVLGFEFDCTERQRWEMGIAIAQYMTSGITQLTRQRRHERLTVSDICIMRPNGETLHCDAVDISSVGMSLRTEVRPPIGERVEVAGVAGRVVRHHPGGIAVELVQNGPSDVVRFPNAPDTDPDAPPDLAG
jgi:hypothetical protein